jgi:hypothetical protein
MAVLDRRCAVNEFVAEPVVIPLTVVTSDIRLDETRGKLDNFAWVVRVGSAATCWKESRFGHTTLLF